MASTPLRPAAAEHPDDLAPDLVRVDAEVGQHARGDTLGLSDEPEQDVLGANVVVPELQRLSQGELENLLRARGERCLATRPLFAIADDALDLLAHLVERDVQRSQSAGSDALVLTQEAQEQVLGANVVVVEVTGLFLGEHHHLAGPFGKSFEH